MSRDLLTRIAELAGTDVASQIATEFGGDQVYIRRSLAPERRVRCSDCVHVKHAKGNLPKCGLSHYTVGFHNPRICGQFELPTMHRINLDRLRGLLHYHLYPTTAALASPGGGWLIPRRRPHPKFYPAKFSCIGANAKFVCPTPDRSHPQ